MEKLYRTEPDWDLKKRPKRSIPRRSRAFAEKMAKIHQKVWKGFVSPDGVVYGPITNLAAFCREFGLEPNNMRSVDKGEYQSSKGWRKADEFDLMDAIPWKPPELEYYLESPVGDIYGPLKTSDQIREVCKKVGMKYRTALKLLNGTLEWWDGWTAVSLPED